MYPWCSSLRGGGRMGCGQARTPLSTHRRETRRLRERAAVRLDSMTNDEAMGRALALAQQAAAAGDVPVGAVVLDAEGRVIGEGRNRREDNGDPLAHAEVLAMRQAAAETRRAWNLASQKTPPGGPRTPFPGCRR